MQKNTIQTDFEKNSNNNIRNMHENSSSEYIDIPSFVFKDRTLSVLEVMVEYFRDNKKMKFKDIASMLNRDERTIWTCYRRAKLKRKGIIKTKITVDGTKDE